MNRKFIEKMMEAKACEREAFASLLTEHTSCHTKELGKEIMTVFVEHATNIIKNCMENAMSDVSGKEQDAEKTEHTKNRTEQSACRSIKVE